MQSQVFLIAFKLSPVALRVYACWFMALCKLLTVVCKVILDNSISDVHDLWTAGASISMCNWSINVLLRKL